MSKTGLSDLSGETMEVGGNFLLSYENFLPSVPHLLFLPPLMSVKIGLVSEYS